MNYSNGIEDDNSIPIDAELPVKSISGGLIEELAELFDGELKPVAPKAQKKVPMPPEWVFISVNINNNFQTNTKILYS